MAHQKDIVRLFLENSSEVYSLFGAEDQDWPRWSKGGNKFRLEAWEGWVCRGDVSRNHQENAL